MANLGSDFIFAEILPRLHSKSLMRFKCVSKSFKTLISSRDFAQSYLRHRYLSSSDLLIFTKDCRIICYELESTASIYMFDWHGDVSIYVVGSSNGLLCIAINKNDFIYLCVLNPTTRICQYIDISDYGELGFNIGFAFDPDNLDFKIVVLSNQQKEGEIKTTLTMVYSLNANSWTEIETNSPGDEIHHGGCVPLINNNLLHWKLWSVLLRKYRIGCFDVCENKWVNDMLLPRYYYDTNNTTYLIDIGFYDGSLFASFENKAEVCYDVWIMKEYGVQDSWFKFFSNPILNDLQKGVVPVAFRGGSSKVLIRPRYSARLLWCNMNNGELSEANFQGASDLLNSKVCMCSTSLVDIPGGKIFGDP